MNFIKTKLKSNKEKLKKQILSNLIMYKNDNDNHIWIV